MPRQGSDFPEGGGKRMKATGVTPANPLVDGCELRVRQASTADAARVWRT
jgi:hypothetical protein